MAKKNSATAVAEPEEEAVTTEAVNDLPCSACGQTPNGQSGERPCEACGVPTLHDSPAEHTGPIIEPPDAEELEKAHYELICESANNISLLEERLESAKRLQKIAKDNYDEAAAEHFAMVRRGPDIPPRRYAKKVRLICDVEADTELGEGFITVQAGTEFDVQEIKGQSVVVLVQGKANALDLGEYAVIEWQTFAPGSTIAPVASEQPEVYPDAWRTAPLSELALPAGLLDKLEEANVSTIGQLEDLRAEIANAKAVWPKGIGEAKTTLIEDRIINWLSEHRDSWGKPIEGDTEIEEEGEDA